MITLTELLTAYEIDRALDRASRDHQGLTASAFGSCDRRAAFVRHDYPVTNTRPAITVATVGSLLHDAIAALWVAQGYEVEVTAEHGTLDAVNDELKEVRDTKSVSRGRFDAWRRNDGPPQSVWKQVHVYGHDHGADESWTLVVDAICRETGRTASYVANYDPSVAADALAELDDRDGVVAKGIPVIPDERYGHGDPVCDNCPFLDACWGEAEEHPVFDGSDIEAMALEYLEATAQAKAADETKKRLRKRLAAASGPYGSTKITWIEKAGRHVEYDSGPYRELRISRVD